MSIFDNILNNIKNFVKESRYNLCFLVLLVLLNIIYLIVALCFNPIYDETDGFIYYLYFNTFINNEFPPIYSNFWPPGIPLFIGGMSVLFGDYFLAGKIILVEFSIVFLLFSYLLIKKLIRAQIALFVFLFLALDQEMIHYYIYEINIDIPSAALILVSLYFLISDNVENNIIYSSIALSLATLVKVTSVCFILIVFIKIVIEELNEESKKTKRTRFYYTILKLIKIFGLYLIVLAPFFVLNLIWFGNPLHNDNLGNVYASIAYYFNIPVPNEFSWWELFFDPEIAPYFYLTVCYSLFLEIPLNLSIYLFYYKIPFLPLISEFFEAEFLITMGGLLVLLIVLIGIFIHYKTQKRKHQIKYILTPLFYIHLSIIIYLLWISMGKFQTRFIFPIIPFIIAYLIYEIICTIEAIYSFLKKIIVMCISRNKSKKPQKEYPLEKMFILLFIIYVIFQSSIALFTITGSYQNELIEYKIAGDFLRDKISTEDKVAMVRKNYIYYIGDCQYSDYPSSENKTQFFMDLEEFQVTLMIISVRNDLHYRPDLWFLIDPYNEFIPENVNLLYIKNDTVNKIAIYGLNFQ